jgi:hypothetical protein
MSIVLLEEDWSDDVLGCSTSIGSRSRRVRSFRRSHSVELDIRKDIRKAEGCKAHGTGTCDMASYCESA